MTPTILRLRRPRVSRPGRVVWRRRGLYPPETDPGALLTLEYFLSGKFDYVPVLSTSEPVEGPRCPSESGADPVPTWTESTYELPIVVCGQMYVRVRSVYVGVCGRCVWVCGICVGVWSVCGCVDVVGVHGFVVDVWVCGRCVWACGTCVGVWWVCGGVWSVCVGRWWVCVWVGGRCTWVCSRCTVDVCVVGVCGVDVLVCRRCVCVCGKCVGRCVSRCTRVCGRCTCV